LPELKTLVGRQPVGMPAIGSEINQENKNNPGRSISRIL